MLFYKHIILIICCLNVHGFQPIEVLSLDEPIESTKLNFLLDNNFSNPHMPDPYFIMGTTWKWYIVFKSHMSNWIWQKNQIPIKAYIAYWSVSLDFTLIPVSAPHCFRLHWVSCWVPVIVSQFIVLHPTVSQHLCLHSSLLWWDKPLPTSEQKETFMAEPGRISTNQFKQPEKMIFFNCYSINTLCYRTIIMVQRELKPSFISIWFRPSLIKRDPDWSIKLNKHIPHDWPLSKPTFVWVLIPFLYFIHTWLVVWHL